MEAWPLAVIQSILSTNIRPWRELGLRRAVWTAGCWLEGHMALCAAEYRTIMIREYRRTRVKIPGEYNHNYGNHRPIGR